MAIGLIIGSIFGLKSQTNPEALYAVLKAQDSLLFDRAFNHCESFLLETLIAEDFEFYHDQGGISPNKASFIKTMKEGICKPENPYPSRRELIPGTLKVYPLFNNGVLYGAIQEGQHRFFQLGSDGKEHEGSTAIFNHLWLLQSGEWKLSRVLSYNHHNP